MQDSNQIIRLFGYIPTVVVFRILVIHALLTRYLTKSLQNIPTLGWHLFVQLLNFELLICIEVRMDEKTLNKKF